MLAFPSLCGCYHQPNHDPACSLAQYMWGFTKRYTRRLQLCRAGICLCFPVFLAHERPWLIYELSNEFVCPQSKSPPRASAKPILGLSTHTKTCDLSYLYGLFLCSTALSTANFSTQMRIVRMTSKMGTPSFWRTSSDISIRYCL